MVDPTSNFLRTEETIQRSQTNYNDQRDFQKDEPNKHFNYAIAIAKRSTQIELRRVKEHSY